jgi:hypothetical protein
LIDGYFLPKNQTYTLNFMARYLEADDHPLKNAGKICFDFVGGRKLERRLEEYVNKRKSDFGLPDGVTFAGIGRCKIELAPPFILQAIDSKIDVAYKDLTSAMRVLGYNMSEL